MAEVRALAGHAAAPTAAQFLTGNRERIMYDITAIRNYEMYGDHHQPDSTTTCKWARAEAAIDEHNRKVVERVWRGIVQRVRAGK